MTSAPGHLDAARWARMRDLFDDLIRLPDGERHARLVSIQAEDPVVHAEVAAMLDQDAAADDLIAHVVSRAADDALRAGWALTRGQTVLHYRIEEPIGEGGMGVVWRATDVTLRRSVAIKILPPDLARPPRRLARFQQEARLLAALNHPGIAVIHGLHEVDEVHFLAMEHIPGEDLARRLSRGPLRQEEAVGIAIQVADALADAHRQGIVHRDLKPGNVMLMPDGRVKVLDFGLATAASDEAPVPGTPVPQALMVTGTAGYMAPEQARGEPVDARADVWAFGALLFEMLTGVRAFGGTTVRAVLQAAERAEPAWPRLREAGVSPDLAALVRRCLAREADARPSSMAAVRSGLEALRARPAPRRLVPWLAAGSLALAIAVGLGWMWPRGAGTLAGDGRVRSVAVLPLVDLSETRDQQFFADGLAEELLWALARNPRLKVTGRTSSFQFRDIRPDPRTVGRALGVDVLLQGSVRRSGTRVRIAAQLVSTTDGFSRWTKTFDREVGDMVAVQTEIADAVADALNVALLHEPATHGSATTGAAYLAYLQGRHFLQLNTEQSLASAVARFTEATTADPAYAPAWVGLSQALTSRVTEGYDGEAVMTQARAAVDRALALDPDSFEARLTLSAIHRVHDWDWTAADREARRAVELAPSDAIALLSAARIASTFGRVEEAYELTSRAAAIDPLDVSIFYRLGRYARFVGHLDDAEARFRHALDLNPTYRGARAELAMVALTRGDIPNAVSEAERETHPMWRLYAQAQAYAAAGRTAESEARLGALIDQYQATYAIQIAAVFIARQQPDEAFAWLERAFRQRDAGLSQLKGAPEFKPLAGDPRFAALLRRLRLPS